MIRLETKPKQYCGYSAVELSEIIQTGKPITDLPPGIQFLIRAGKLFVVNGKLYRKRLSKDTNRYETKEVPVESYFVTTVTRGVVHQLNSLEEAKLQFQIING